VWLLTSIHRSGQCEVFAVRVHPQLPRPGVGIVLRRPGTSVVQTIVVVEQSAEVRHRVALVQQRVQLVRVPGQVDVVARYQHRVTMAQLQTDELPVALERLQQKPLVAVVRQGDVVEELGLASDGSRQVVQRLTLVTFH